MAEHIRFVEVEGVDGVRIADACRIEGFEPRNHAAAGAGRDQREVGRSDARGAQQFGLHHGPVGRAAALRRLVERLERDACGIEPGQPRRKVAHEAEIAGKQRRRDVADQIARIVMMRRAVRMQIDDDGQRFVVAKLDCPQNVGEQPLALRAREREQRPGIDRQAHEIDARRAKGREIAAHRNGAVALKRRPVVIGAGRGKFARQRKPRPQIHPAPQPQSTRLRADDRRHRQRAERHDDAAAGEHGQACRTEESGAGSDFGGSSR